VSGGHDLAQTPQPIGSSASDGQDSTASVPADRWYSPMCHREQPLDQGDDRRRLPAHLRWRATAKPVSSAHATDQHDLVFIIFLVKMKLVPH
jgi:hypothetical protein